MTAELIVFPDIELWTVGYLRTAFAARSETYAADVYVSNAVPSTRRDRMVVVRRDGGQRLDVVRESARLTVNTWAKTQQDAADLARLTAALLWIAPDGDTVVKATQVTGPSPVADSSGQPLRFMSFEIVTRGSTI